MCISNDSLVSRNSCLYFMVMDKEITYPLQSQTEEGRLWGFLCVRLFDCTFIRFSMFLGVLFAFLLVCVWGFVVVVVFCFFFHFRGNFLCPREQKNLITIFSLTAADD